MRILEHTIVTEYKQYDAAERAADQIETVLQLQKLDTYKHTYVIRVTVDQVDPIPEPPDDEEEDN